MDAIAILVLIGCLACVVLALCVVRLCQRDIENDTKDDVRIFPGIVVEDEKKGGVKRG